MHAFAVVLSLTLSAAAYQVTAPSNTSGWSSTGTNTLSWDRVDTDASTFSVILTNEDRSVLPVNDQLLASNVDGSVGSIAIPSPSGGLPTGKAFRVDLIKSDNDVSTIFAQSNEFQIVSGSASASVSVTASSSVSGSSSFSNSAVSAGTTVITPTLSPGNSASGSASDSGISPTPTTNAAFALNVNNGLLGLGLLLGALMA